MEDFVETYICKLCVITPIARSIARTTGFILPSSMYVHILLARGMGAMGSVWGGTHYHA